MTSVAEMMRKCAAVGCEKRQIALLCLGCYGTKVKVSNHRSLGRYKRYMRDWKDKLREAYGDMREDKPLYTTANQRCKNGAE